MRTWAYTIVEHDPEQPWIVVGEIRRLTVELEDGASFHDWAAKEWPHPRYQVELDPWQLGTTLELRADGDGT
jgi:hypothetical protein